MCRNVNAVHETKTQTLPLLLNVPDYNTELLGIKYLTGAGAEYLQKRCTIFLQFFPDHFLIHMKFSEFTWLALPQHHPFFPKWIPG